MTPAKRSGEGPRRGGRGGRGVGFTGAGMSVIGDVQRRTDDTKIEELIDGDEDRQASRFVRVPTEMAIFSSARF